MGGHGMEITLVLESDASDSTTCNFTVLTRKINKIFDFFSQRHPLCLGVVCSQSFAFFVAVASRPIIDKDRQIKT